MKIYRQRGLVVIESGVPSAGAKRFSLPSSIDFIRAGATFTIVEANPGLNFEVAATSITDINDAAMADGDAAEAYLSSVINPVGGSVFVETLSDGATTNANGDYSSAAVAFKYTATGYETVARLIVTVGDQGSIDAGGYGNIAALTNGVRIRLNKSGSFTYYDSGLPIKTNIGWGSLCYDADPKTWGTGNEYLLVRYTFTNAGAPVVMAPGDSFEITVNDDLTGLVLHEFIIEGLR